MTQGYNNLTAYQQMLADTAPKPAEYAVADKLARALNGGKDYTPRTIMQKQPTVNPGFSPIKGVGGLAGASMMLLPEWNSFTRNLWRNMNLNTMDPAERDRMLKGYQQTMALFGKDKEGELAKKYPGYQYNSNNTEAPSNMPVVAKAVYNLLSGNKEKATPQGTLIPTPQQNQSLTKSSSIAGGGAPTGMAAPTIEEQLMAMAPSAKGGSTTTETSPENLQAINDYISKLQEINKPYTEALTNYVNNYNDLVRGNFNAQRYFTAMAGLAKNPGYVKLADALNPLNNEANRINAMKMARDAEAGNVNAINEMMGNLAVATGELGLPPEAAFANKNLLTAMSMQNRDNTKLEIAIANNLVKKYGIDKNYARALAQQQLKNQGSLGVALTYVNGGGGVAPGLNAQGGAQTSYKSPINNQQSQEATLFQQVTGH